MDLYYIITKCCHNKAPCAKMWLCQYVIHNVYDRCYSVWWPNVQLHFLQHSLTYDICR